MNGTRPAYRLTLTAPMIFLVLAATAIPIELHNLGEARLSFSLDLDNVSDIIANLIGYLPVGIVLGRLGKTRAVLIAALISGFAETGQLVMVHRDPSLVDVLSNVAGAALGAFASARWKIRVPAFQIRGWTAALAATTAAALFIYAWFYSGGPINTRGATSTGTLEAQWKLNETGGDVVLDYSGHELAGKFRKEPKRTAGRLGTATVLDGTNYVDFGQSSVLRLAGSMTISAWIKSSSYPADDAAIVSNFTTDGGFQVDTTIDRGPRTIGFKLSDACGKLVVRYGYTPLTLNTWYHVAGVYDAASQTMDVYLNGQLDNGLLSGSVSSAQRSSRQPLYVGRRGSSRKFDFSGAMGDVRIYSFALTKSLVEAEMRGEGVNAPEPQTQRVPPSPPCATLSDPEDKILPFIAALLGTLVAVACLGVRPTTSPLLVLGISMATGALLLTVISPNLPSFNTWTLPLIALAGGTTVVASFKTGHSVS